MHGVQNGVHRLHDGYTTRYYWCNDRLERHHEFEERLCHLLILNDNGRRWKLDVIYSMDDVRRDSSLSHVVDSDVRSRSDGDTPQKCTGGGVQLKSAPISVLYTSRMVHGV